MLAIDHIGHDDVLLSIAGFMINGIYHPPITLDIRAVLVQEVLFQLPV